MQKNDKLRAIPTQKMMENLIMSIAENEQNNGGGGNGGSGLGERVAKIESDIEYIKRDISETKQDVRVIKDKISSVNTHHFIGVIVIIATIVTLFITLYGVLPKTP